MILDLKRKSMTSHQKNSGLVLPVIIHSPAPPRWLIELFEPETCSVANLRSATNFPLAVSFALGPWKKDPVLKQFSSTTADDQKRWEVLGKYQQLHISDSPTRQHPVT
jgi:hypothetical protein